MADTASSSSQRSRGKRFFHIARAKRIDSPPPPVPHYSPVSPLEEDGSKVRVPEQDLWPGQRSPTVPPAPMSTASTRSDVSPQRTSVFDEAPEEPETELTTTLGGDEASYDLRPPVPKQHANMEVLAGRLFSIDHVNVILRDSVATAKLTRFLRAYRPKYSSVFKQYAESRKAMLALQYANAIAGNLNNEEHDASIAAALDRGFQTQINQKVEGLLSEALPAYITHRLTQLVTDTLVKQITQTGAPILRELVPDLAEVYCISDPSLGDNPIVYASQEFYKVSQYGQEFVLGRNCRFLQGPKTSNSTIQRLVNALKTGQEVCETVLNYKRDGTPFINLLLIAPLYDDKGSVRYFLGCQIDVSPLIEGGRGLDTFAELLSQERVETRFAGALDREPTYALGQLGQMLSDEEVSAIRSATLLSAISPRPAGSRRIIGADAEDEDQPIWPQQSHGPSGKLPGVYQNYILVRPFPSLRITFTSPAMRIPGLLQAKLLDRVGSGQHVKDSILDSFAHGTGFTAKVQWLTPALNASNKLNQQTRWLHATPLMGADEQVGVWMVVIVEQEEVTGSLRRPMPAMAHQDSLQFGAVNSSVRSTSTSRGKSNLYAEYLQEEGRRADSAMRSDLLRNEFQDF